jgi:DNA mismatch repair protein MutS
MVEMTETANILNNATERSLVILDEVGRGTSTFDGVSLAWAITEYLHNEVEARTLFATHYHEVAELGGILDRAANCNVAVRDWEGEVVFLHRIEPGSCDRSYGIQVGRLAGIPQGVIERAREILRGLEAQAAERDWNLLHEGEALRSAARAVQGDLFAPQGPDHSALVKELAATDTDRLAPVEAHALLRRLADKARG